MNTKNVFSSFAVSDLQAAKDFYGATMGLEVTEEKEMGLLRLVLPEGGTVMLYPKENHTPASFTVLNFVVDNIDEAVDALLEKGITFEKYEGFNQDEKGISRNKGPEIGPEIAWFKDPAGNILSVLEDV